MSNQHLKMQEELWSEIDFRIEEEYQKVMSNALYWNDRLKKNLRELQSLTLKKSHQMIIF